jgi:hypothetical protein
MKLYSVHNSNNCRRVNATIQHLGLEVEVLEQAMSDLKKPEFLAMNPNGKVPTFVDGDVTLWESRSIMQYVASKKAGNTLWPADPKRQADIARWQFWESSHLSRGTGAYAFEKLFKKIFMKQDPDPAALAVGEKEWHTYAPVLNTSKRASGCSATNSRSPISAWAPVSASPSPPASRGTATGISKAGGRDSARSPRGRPRPRSSAERRGHRGVGRLLGFAGA